MSEGSDLGRWMDPDVRPVESRPPGRPPAAGIGDEYVEVRSPGPGWNPPETPRVMVDS